MKSSAVGKRTSKADRAGAPEVEILSVSPHGVWLSALGQEYLLRYQDHPWFRDVPVAHIFNVQLLHGHHLHWPDCDVDLHIDSLATPERFPLTSVKSGPPPKRAKQRR